MNKASAHKSRWGGLGLCVDPANLKTSARAEAGGKKPQPYKPLPKEFQRDGFNYRQVARERDCAIYEQTWNGCAEPSVRFEVVRVRRRDGFKIDGRFVEPAETYPGSASWGSEGWTLHSREAAFAKLRSICR